MFGWFKRRKKNPLHIYKVQYVLCASIYQDKVTFDLKDLNEEFVEATDIIDAQSKIASRIPLTPHVYIHKISKVDLA